MKRQIINQNTFQTAADHSAHGVHAVEMAGNLADGLGGWPGHYAKITVSQQAATTARVNPGLLFVRDRAYDLDAPFDVALLDRVPLQPGDTVWIGLVLRGAVVMDMANRQVRINVATGENDVRMLPRTERHTVECVPLAGVPGPTPIKPPIPADTCVVAWVLLGNTSIQSIEMYGPHRAKTLYEVEGRLTLVEGRIDNLFQTTATLRTDLTATNAVIANLPSPEITYQVQRRVAAMTRIIDDGLRGEAFSALFDNGLDRDPATTIWDYDHPEWHARVWQGIRHPFAAENQQRIELLNAANPDVMVHATGMTLPKYVSEPRIVVEGNDGSQDIAGQQVTEVTVTQYEVPMSSTTYGESFIACENAREYQGAQDKQVGDVFLAGDRQIEIVDIPPVHHNLFYAVHDPAVLEEHTMFTFREVITYSWSEPRWRYDTQVYSVNGNHVGQTFLNSQLMIATGLGLTFTRVGGSGDVTLTLCQTDRSGAPLVEVGLEKATRVHASLALGHQVFGLRPALMPTGRFGFFTSTMGNHALADVQNNKFAEGSMFRFTDGIWAVPDGLRDLAFTVYGARFESTRTIVPLRSITLENGMTEIQVRHKGFVPPGTSLSFELRQPNGPWLDFRSNDGSPFAGRPVQLEMRAVFLGTTSLQPGIVLDADAVVIARRPSTTMVAVTKLHQLGASFTNIVAQVRIDGFDPAIHTSTIRLITGGVERTPTATWIDVDPLDATKRILRGTFTVPATTSARLKATLASTTASRIAFIENVYMAGKN